MFNEQEQESAPQLDTLSQKLCLITKHLRSSKTSSRIDPLYQQVIQKNFQIIDFLLRKLNLVFARHEEIQLQFTSFLKRLNKIQSDIEIIHNEHRRNNLQLSANIENMKYEITGIDTHIKMIYDDYRGIKAVGGRSCKNIGGGEECLTDNDMHDEKHTTSQTQLFSRNLNVKYSKFADQKQSNTSFKVLDMCDNNQSYKNSVKSIGSKKILKNGLKSKYRQSLDLQNSTPYKYNDQVQLQNDFHTQIVQTKTHINIEGGKNNKKQQNNLQNKQKQNSRAKLNLSQMQNGSSRIISQKNVKLVQNQRVSNAKVSIQTTFKSSLSKPSMNSEQTSIYKKKIKSKSNLYFVSRSQLKARYSNDSANLLQQKGKIKNLEFNTIISEDNNIDKQNLGGTTKDANQNLEEVLEVVRREIKGALIESQHHLSQNVVLSHQLCEIVDKITIIQQKLKQINEKFNLYVKIQKFLQDKYTINNQLKGLRTYCMQNFANRKQTKQALLFMQTKVRNIYSAQPIKQIKQLQISSIQSKNTQEPEISKQAKSPAISRVSMENRHSNTMHDATSYFFKTCMANEFVNGKDKIAKEKGSRISVNQWKKRSKSLLRGVDRNQIISKYQRT